MSDQVLDAIDEVKKELVAIQLVQGNHGLVQNQILEQARLTNGRIGALEAWKQAVLVADAHDKGVLQGAATAALTKGQLRALIAAVTAITTVSGTIVGVIVKFAG